MSEVAQVESTPEIEIHTVSSTSKSKSKSSGDYIVDTAKEIEGLSKIKAINQAHTLAEAVEENYFKLGGVLNRIRENQWYEGFENFGDFVLSEFGFSERKARYLMDDIYVPLVNNAIPWDKVKGLGWTKLKDLAPILTLDNLDYLVQIANDKTVAELIAFVKAYKAQGGEGESEVSATTTTNVQTLKIKGMFPDQIDMAQKALAKAKAEVNTNFDNVAVNAIFANYLGNVSTVDLKSLIEQAGFFPVVNLLSDLYKGYELTIDYANNEEGMALKAAADAQAAQQQAS